MHKIQQAIKWTVYTLLIINFVFYAIEDWDRTMHVLDGGFTFLEWTNEFANSIDETAWFVLLFLLELETYALSDKALSGWMGHTIRGARLVCVVMLAHTIYAYVGDVVDLQPTVVVEGVSDLCEMTDSDLSWVSNLEYTKITGETCSSLSNDSTFFWRTDGVAVTDAGGLQLERNLAWVDLVEALVWILILLAIEIVVRLQDHGVSGGTLIATVNAAQIFLYAILLAVAAYWATLSHWLYVWDELLWIGGFAAIEMNLSEWRGELREDNEPAAEH